MPVGQALAFARRAAWFAQSGAAICAVHCSRERAFEGWNTLHPQDATDDGGLCHGRILHQEPGTASELQEFH
eukprot:3533180-Amphidinium_carterae.2